LDSLPEYLLGLAVAEMSKYVDTLALNRLAREYAESVMRSGPSWLHPFAARQASPVEELDKLNRVLEAIDAHLLFVIEDVDRNAPPDDLPTASTQLQSLLDRLRPCKRLSFILAVGNATLDFDRLCDVKIYVPYLPAKMICDTVNKYGSQWMKEAKNDGIHIDSDMGRLFADSSMIRITGLDRDIRLGTDDISLVGLLRTPRRLKAVLNDTKRSWKTLRGEVDFKQLLALATIRAAAPHVVDALHDVRARNHDMSVSQLKAYLDWRDQQIEQAIQRADLEDRDHLNVLAKIFLPRDDPNVFQDVNQDRNQKGDVYWRRIWMGSWVEARGTPRDQDVLSVIKQWKEGKEKEGNVRKLAERLTTDAPFAAVFERLMSSSKLPPIFKVEDQEIWSLVVALKEVVVDRNGQDAAWEDNYTVKSMCDLGLRIVSDNEVNRLLNEEKNRLGLILTKKLQNQN
jgi:hypothetical protein